MTNEERKVFELALEALLKTQNEGFNLPGSAIREAITAIKEALAQPEQEPVAVVDVHEFYDNCANFSLLQKLPKGKHTLYTTPPQRKPLTDEWVPVTQKLLNEQHPWLYQPMWIAMKGGVVVQGYYEWRQGRNPDRFITDLGDEWAFNADFVMPITKPAPPAIEAAHNIKE